MNGETMEVGSSCDHLNETFLILNETNGNSSDVIVPQEKLCPGHAPTLTNSALIKSTVLLVMAAFSLFGNVATMINIQKKHRSRHMYTLIFHLAISDISVTLWCLIGEAIWYLTVEWIAGNVECKIFKFVQMFSLYLSTFIMVSMGIDRLIAVKYPLKSMETGRCFKMVKICWVMAAVLSLPQVLVFHVGRGPFIEEFYQCVTHGVYTEPWQEKLYAVFSMVCMFFFPLVILVTTYILTFLTLHRNQDFMNQNNHSELNRSHMDRNRRKLLRKAKMKSLRISVVIVMFFLICWIPYHVMMTIFIFFSPDSENSYEDLKTGIFFFGMSNSLCNPVIYSLFHVRKPRNKNQRGSVRRQREAAAAMITNHVENIQKPSSFPCQNYSINCNSLQNHTEERSKILQRPSIEV